MFCEKTCEQVVVRGASTQAHDDPVCKSDFRLSRTNSTLRVSYDSEEIVLIVSSLDPRLSDAEVVEQHLRREGRASRSSRDSTPINGGVVERK